MLVKVCIKILYDDWNQWLRTLFRFLSQVNFSNFNSSSNPCTPWGRDKKSNLFLDWYSVDDGFSTMCRKNTLNFDSNFYTIHYTIHSFHFKRTLTKTYKITSILQLLFPFFVLFSGASMFILKWNWRQKRIQRFSNPI